VSPDDYQRQPAMTSRLTTRPPVVGYPAPNSLYGLGYYYPGYFPYGYPGYYPYYWRPTIGIGFGGGFYGRR
jgi:hypothetical protein